MWWMPMITPGGPPTAKTAAIHSAYALVSEGMEGGANPALSIAPTYSPESALSVYETCQGVLSSLRSRTRIFHSTRGIAECLSVLQPGQSVRPKLPSKTGLWALDTSAEGPAALEKHWGGTQRVVPMRPALGTTGFRLTICWHSSKTP